MTRKSPFYKKAFSFTVSFFAYKSADLITVTSNEIKEFITETFNLSHKPIFVHGNYINTDVFHYHQRDLSLNKMVYVGRLNRHKNIDLIIKICARLNISLDIIGNGEEEVNLKSLANLSLEKYQSKIKISFLGSRPNHLLGKLYSEYTYFCLPSSFEGNSKVILEAMSSGLIVVATDILAISEVVTDSQNGYLITLNEEEFLQKMKVILSKDSNELLKISKASHEYIEKNNSLNSYLNFLRTRLDFFNNI